jgi:hypothetical protein
LFDGGNNAGNQAFSLDNGATLKINRSTSSISANATSFIADLDSVAGGTGGTFEIGSGTSFTDNETGTTYNNTGGNGTLKIANGGNYTKNTNFTTTNYITYTPMTNALN